MIILSVYFVYNQFKGVNLYPFGNITKIFQVVVFEEP